MRLTQSELHGRHHPRSTADNDAKCRGVRCSVVGLARGIVLASTTRRHPAKREYPMAKPLYKQGVEGDS